jgi:hypothetical protein
MAEAGLNADSKKLNMPLVFGLTYVFSFFIAVFLQGNTIHQFAFGSLLMPARGFTDPEGFQEAIKTAALLSEGKFHSWSHGMVHGIIFSIMFVLPLISIDAMFARKSWKYIMINWGYWLIAITIMAMIVCQFA